MDERRIGIWSSMNVSNFSTKARSSSMDAIGLIACLMIGLGLRLFIILNQASQLTVDRDAYLGIATSVVEGRAYSSPGSTDPTAFRPPLYPLVLAIGFCVLS